MTDQELSELALQAWKGGMGDAGTAVWLLCQVTDLSIEEALARIKKTAARIGGKLTVQLPTDAEVAQAVAALISLQAHAIPAQARSNPALAEHRAARGVRKMRGEK
jgi:hypothetical protein